MKRITILIFLVLVFTNSLFAQLNVHLNVGDYWNNYYSNTKNIRADVSVSGGTAQVLVLDAYNLQLFRQGKSYISFYNYGWVSSVSVNLNLQKKTNCYLVVSNIGGFVSKDVGISLYK